MDTVAATFVRLADEVAATRRTQRSAHRRPAGEIAKLPVPSIADPYRLHYVTGMVEVAAHRAGVVPPLWTAAVVPLDAPVFIDPSLNLRAHLLTASPPPFRRRNIFIDSSIGDRV